MNIRSLVAAALAVFSLAPAMGAKSAKPAVALQYHWTAGQTLRYLIQRDPYFADPVGGVKAVNDDASYQPPIVERLTETVVKVSANGVATLALTLTAEPGFEDETQPQKPLKRTVTVAPSGQILTITGGTLGNSPPERDLLRGIWVLPAATDSAGDASQAVWTQTLPPTQTERQSPDHDGTLLLTTYAAQSDRVVFDRRAGSLVRQSSTVTISSRLVMTGRGRRGVADFGHVVPKNNFVQTLTVERQTDLP